MRQVHGNILEKVKVKLRDINIPKQWGEEGKITVTQTPHIYICKNTNLHVNCVRFIAKRFGRLLRHSFSLNVPLKEAAGGKGRCEFMLRELLCGQGPAPPVPSVRHFVALPAAIPSPQRLLQLILEQLLAGVGRNTIDRHKHWDFTSLKLP